MTSRNELLLAFRGSLAELESTLFQLSDQQFFQKPSEDKWSIAENTQHLILSVEPINLALALPLILLKIFGSPQQHRSYEDIVQLYQHKLAEGSTASLPFIPRGIKTSSNKPKMLSNLAKAYQKLINLVGELTEEDLDNYSMPHPILGKVSIREMLYFTLYHIRHHHEIIKKYFNI